VGDKDKEDTGNVVICGARCVFQKNSKCHHKKKTAAAVIGIDGQCVRFETAEK